MTGKKQSDLSSFQIYFSKLMFSANLQASQREDSYEETIRDLTQRLKDVSTFITVNFKLFSFSSSDWLLPFDRKTLLKMDCISVYFYFNTNADFPFSF